MVMLTFIGMFTNQYIPMWMKDNESNHMNNVVGQLSNLKSGIDMQVLNNNQQVASAPIYSPIALHAEGVPVFSSPTMGTLTFTSEKDVGGAYIVISFDYISGGTTYTLDSTNGGKTGGSLEFYGANRYFIQQNVTYENGGIILNQTDGEAMLSGISIRLVASGGELSMKITLTSLTGVSKTVAGFGTKSITSTLEYTTYQKMENRPVGSDVTLRIVTKYPFAWKQYYESLFEKTGVPGTVTNQAVDPGNPDYRSITVTIPDVNVLEYTKAVATITIADIGV